MSLSSVRSIAAGCPLALVVACSFLVAGCQQTPPTSQSGETPQSGEMPPEEEGPTAKAPSEYGIGTTFSINLIVNGETVAMTDTLVRKIERDGRTLDVYEHSAPVTLPGDPCDGESHAVLDAETRSWAGCMSDGKFLAEVQPHTGRFAWPLQVGKKGRAPARWVDHAVQPDWSGEYWTDFEVLAYEEVTVPAGRFMAFKVANTGSPSNDFYETIWYSPQVGSFVKILWGRTEENGYGPLEGSWELVNVEFN